MAKQQSHFTVSLGLALLYAAAGAVLLALSPETVFLASVVVVMAGMLPNVDESQSGSAQEFGGLLAAVSPIVFLEFFPKFRGGGITRVTLVVICCYLLSRILVARLLKSWTTHRGLFHSIPAAIITSELVYLLFWDLSTKARIYLAFAGFLGFFTHLLMDAYTNVDLVGRVMGRGVAKQPKVLKLRGATNGGTFMMYACMIVLGWFVMKDVYPGLRFVADVKY